MYDVDVHLDGPVLERPSREPPGDDRAEERHEGMLSPGGEAAARTLSETPAKQKWWHVPDDKIEEMIRQSMDLPLSDYVGGGSMSRSLSSPSQSTASLAGKQQSPSPSRSLSRAGGSVVSGRSPSTASLARRRDGKISVKIFIAESGDTLVLKLHPGTRIGPMKQLPKNRFTDIFGEEAGSPLRSTARDTDSQASLPTLNQMSLKEIITSYSTVEVFRQRLAFKKNPMSNDDLTLEAYGIKDGDVVSLGVLKTGCGDRNRPGSVTEAAENLRRNGGLSQKRGDSDAWLIPKWVHQDKPNVIGTMKQKGPRTDFKDFSINSIYLPDMHDRSLSCVRVAVTGSSTYTGR